MSILGELAVGIAIACGCLALLAPRSAPLRLDLTRLSDWIRVRRASAETGRTVEVLQATHAALRSGIPVAGALRLALEGAGPAARAPFERALRAFELNLDLDAALREVRSTARDRRLSLALDALVLVAGERLPSARAAAVVGSVAERLAFEERLADEIVARTSGVRAQVVLLALVVPALALYLTLTMPGLAATLASPLGLRVLVPLAAVLEVTGIVASRRIVRSSTA